MPLASVSPSLEVSRGISGGVRQVLKIGIWLSPFELGDNVIDLNSTQM